jgi:hypothetical protein
VALAVVVLAAAALGAVGKLMQNVSSFPRWFILKLQAESRSASFLQ